MIPRISRHSPDRKEKKKCFREWKTFCRGAKLPAYGLLGEKQDFKETWKVAVPQRKEEKEGSPHREWGPAREAVCVGKAQTDRHGFDSSLCRLLGSWFSVGRITSLNQFPAKHR